MDLTNTGSPENIALMDQFKVLGLPSILFFDLNGNEINNKRVTGFKSADEFTAHLELFL